MEKIVILKFKTAGIQGNQWVKELFQEQWEQTAAFAEGDSIEVIEVRDV